MDTFAVIIYREKSEVSAYTQTKRWIMCKAALLAWSWKYLLHYLDTPMQWASGYLHFKKGKLKFTEVYVLNRIVDQIPYHYYYCFISSPLYEIASRLLIKWIFNFTCLLGEQAIENDYHVQRKKMLESAQKGNSEKQQNKYFNTEMWKRMLDI